ncbi:hypothetical protein K503DRAFT_858782 [Rhizopogon vinicolor AM-OR11-026]|uniref:Uncharacterized protein n=1 Tax=Rhizopogon vinicolor AM-OR11-026 TaxID=1314800 RepID=A0A1B7MRE5_9AGAM|nr:hypothetical protein K503DRAFT_858782 [Rhizopogon vinicolor AM-OR11-026]
MKGSRPCKPTGQKCDYVERKQYDRTFTNDSGLPLEVDERTDSSSSLGVSVVSIKVYCEHAASESDDDTELVVFPHVNGNGIPSTKKLAKRLRTVRRVDGVGWTVDMDGEVSMHIFTKETYTLQRMLTGKISGIREGLLVITVLVIVSADRIMKLAGLSVLITPEFVTNSLVEQA